LASSEAVVPLSVKPFFASSSFESLIASIKFSSCKYESVWNGYIKNQKATKWIRICRQFSLDMKFRVFILPLQPTLPHWRCGAKLLSYQPRHNFCLLNGGAHLLSPALAGPMRCWLQGLTKCLAHQIFSAETFFTFPLPPEKYKPCEN
jgi:hypothetical protein